MLLDSLALEHGKPAKEADAEQALDPQFPSIVQALKMHANRMPDLQASIPVSRLNCNLAPGHLQRRATGCPSTSSSASQQSGLSPQSSHLKFTSDLVKGAACLLHVQGYILLLPSNTLVKCH